MISLRGYLIDAHKVGSVERELSIDFLAIPADEPSY